MPECCITKQVMLVDDEVEAVTFMGRFLRRWNIFSIICTSGEEALEKYDKDAIGLVVLDLHLLNIDGFQVLKKLKERDPAARVVVLTGRCDDESQRKVRELGALECLYKPMDVRDFKRMIDTYWQEAEA
jgi:DNA-binding response OmpR family regulator